MTEVSKRLMEMFQVCSNVCTKVTRNATCLKSPKSTYWETPSRDRAWPLMPGTRTGEPTAVPFNWGPSRMFPAMWWKGKYRSSDPCVELVKIATTAQLMSAAITGFMLLPRSNWNGKTQLDSVCLWSPLSPCTQVCFAHSFCFCGGHRRIMNKPPKGSFQALSVHQFSSRTNCHVAAKVMTRHI